MKLKYKWEICSKEYSTAYSKNKRRRKKHPDYIPNITCEYCGNDRKTPAGKGIHERVCKLNPDRKPLINNGNYKHFHGIKNRAPEWGIRQEDIRQIAGTDKGLLEKNNFTLFYWH